MKSNDIELLRRYVFARSEAAFAELVGQHIALVYSAALRRTNGDTSLAEDVTQEVFTDLARKAARLTGHTSLAGWLYTSTRYAAAALRRAEQRRCAREQEVHAMNELLQSGGTDPAWEQLRPILDEAMDDLKAEDREAVLLRFFERLPLAAVGARLGVTENAAQMRVARALDKLRGALAKRGVTSTAGALAVILAGQAAGGVPAGLAASVSAAALAAAGTASALSVLLAKLLISTKLKMLAGTALVVAVITPLVWHFEGANRRAAAVSRPNQPTAATLAGQRLVLASNNPATLATSAARTNTSTLRLTILAADAKKPVPAVEVECTASMGRLALRTKFVSRRDGICDVHYPKDAKALELVSRTDGFADTRLHWDPAKGDTVPTNYTLRLARAVRIGGFVRAEDGSPVAGAEVDFNMHEEDEGRGTALDHENYDFSEMKAVADAEGHWSLERIAPEVLWRSYGSVNHSGYLLKMEEFESREAREQLRKEAFVFQLSRAIKVRGSVEDAQGNPISGARILVGDQSREEFMLGKSQPDGSFAVERGRPGATLITFTAKGFAPKVMKLEAEADSTPLRVVLEPGRPLQLRVVDEAGRPVARASVSVDLPSTERARLASTDRGGKATLHEAPAGAMVLCIEAAGFKEAQATLSADGEEHSIVLTRKPKLVVSGTVTDAASGQPVRTFGVICGVAVGDDALSTNRTFKFIPGDSRDWFKFGGGKFRLDLGRFLAESFGWRDSKEAGLMLKFEADGYAPALSRMIRTNEAEAQLEMALTPAEAVNVTVLNPGGRQATKAEIGPVRGGAVIWVSGEGHLSGDTGAGVSQVDSEGAFFLPPDDSIKWVIAVSSQGFAKVSPSALSRDPTLQLQPFGRVEGRWVVGNQPVVGREVAVDTGAWQNDGPDSDGYDLRDCSAKTDAEGRFAIPQVPAGKYKLNWRVTRDRGYFWRELTNVEVRPGETSTVALGGYVVRVRVRWPADLTPGKSTRVTVNMHTPYPEPSAAVMQDPQAYAQWKKSPEAQAKEREVRHYGFAEGADGVWTSEGEEAVGVEAGFDYTLVAKVWDESVTNGSPVIAEGELPVSVPAAPATGSMDAGEVVLHGVKTSSPLAPLLRNGGEGN